MSGKVIQVVLLLAGLGLGGLVGAVGVKDAKGAAATGVASAAGDKKVLVDWAEVESYECTYGDCEDGRGTLEIQTPYGAGSYSGNFRDGELHGYGRLELPVSFLAKAVYHGHWQAGLRHGRGTYYNGRGNLYIGQWQGDKRHGHGSYFFNLHDWQENKHTEYWLQENYENYTGGFRDGNYHGQGVYRWADGKRYEGGFFASDKHGFGTFYYETGTSRKQLWHYGDFVR